MTEGKLKIVEYSTGAKREDADDKIDYEGFMSPLVVEAFAEYMHFNRYMPDGTKRDSDNWQEGMPYNHLMKSLWRHFFDVWKEHRGWKSKEGIVWACCGVLFNVSCYLNQVLLNNPTIMEKSLRDAEKRRGTWIDKEEIGFVRKKADEPGQKKTEPLESSPSPSDSPLD